MSRKFDAVSTLEWELKVLKMGQFVREYKFDPVRKWRFDFAFVKEKVAVEIDGGVFLGAKGGHTSGVGYTSNCEKGNAAVLQGWRVLHFTPDHVKSGYARQTLKEILK